MITRPTEMKALCSPKVAVSALKRFDCFTETTDEGSTIHKATRDLLDASLLHLRHRTY